MKQSKKFHTRELEANEPERTVCFQQTITGAFQNRRFAKNDGECFGKIYQS